MLVVRSGTGRVWAPAAIWLVGLVLPSGCDAARYSISESDARTYAEFRCEANSSCCEEPDPACVETLADEILSYQSLTDVELTFSESCMREALDWVPTLACERSHLLEAPACRLAHGTKQHGASCFTFGDFGFWGTDCAEGLRCHAGLERCVDEITFSPLPAQEGETCGGASLASCEPDLFCEDGICRRRSGAEDACTQHAECPLEHYCEGLQSEADGTCQPVRSIGEACEVDDACDFSCEGGACIRLRCSDNVCNLPGPAVCEGY